MLRAQLLNYAFYCSVQPNHSCKTTTGPDADNIIQWRFVFFYCKVMMSTKQEPCDPAYPSFFTTPTEASVAVLSHSRPVCRPKGQCRPNFMNEHHLTLRWLTTPPARQAAQRRPKRRRQGNERNNLFIDLWPAPPRRTKKPHSRY